MTVSKISGTSGYYIDLLKNIKESKYLIHKQV